MSGVFVDLGADNDVAGGAAFNDTILGNVGDDTIAGFGGNDSLLGGNDNDFINGGDGDDTIYGGSGNDLLLAGVGNNDRLFGEGGNDSFLADSTPGSAFGAYFDGGAGDDTFRVYARSDTLIGGIGTDRVEFLSGNQTIDLRAFGSDRASGIDHLVLSGTNQQLIFDYNSVIRLTDAGTLRVSGITGNVINLLGWVQGTSSGGFTSFTLGTSPLPLATVLVADNLLSGVPGATLSGTEGNDSTSLGLGSDSYLGLGGSDSVLGNAGNDTIDGGNGGDTIYGEAGNDSILGGDGDDRLYGGLGNDTIDAGAGNSDRIRYEDLASSDPVTVVISNSGSNSGFNRATVSTATQGTDSIMGFEILTTTTGNDFITVDSVATANASLNLFANDGNDTIIFNTSDLGVLADYQHGSTLGGVTVDLLAGTAIDPFGTDSLVGVRGINGSDQSDIFLGSDFNDRFRGRQGNDYMDGRGGSDIADYAYLGSGQAISVNLAEGRANDGQGGTDTLISIEQVRGGSGNDTIIGDSANNNIIRGNAGSDSLDGGAGTSDVVDYSLNSLGVSVDLVAGRGVDGATSTDTLAGFEQVHGSAFADTLIADAFESNVLRGNAGNDLLDGRGGSGDIVDYSPNSSAQAVSVDLVAGRANDGANGSDTLIGIEQVYGGSGNDTILGDGLDNLVRGNAGSDSLDGGAGTSDVLDYSNSSASVSVNLAAGRANDGANGTDTIAGFERVWGGSASDTLIGDVGDQVLRGNAGSDSLDGGAGSADVADYRNATTGITVNLATGVAQDGQGGTDTLAGIERIWGSTFNDSILGGAGDDFFVGSSGADTFVGGDGNDAVSYAFNPANNTSATQGVSIDLASGAGRDGFNSAESLVGIERIDGSGLSDTISGSAAAETFYGNGGAADSLNGAGGADWLTGGAGNDTLLGGDGADTINASAGNDSLAGGADGDLYLAGSTSLTLRINDIAGNDTLSFQGATGGSIPVASLDAVVGIEAIDLAGGGNTLNLSASRVAALSDNDVLRVYGGGNDRLIFDDPNGWSGSSPVGGFVTFTNGSGNATVIAAQSLVPLPGGPTNGAETLTGTSGADTVDLLAGNDSYLGLFGNDSILGGDGADTLNGGDGNDTLLGGNGADSLFGDSGADSLSGGNGDDTVVGSGLSLIAPSGSFTLSGDDGNDLVLMRAGYAYVDASLSGGAGNDTINGGDSRDTISGGEGDMIDGGAGDDVVLVGGVTLAEIYALFGP